MAIGLFAVTFAGAFEAIAVLAIPAGRDTFIATTLLAIGTIADTAAVRGIAHLAFGAGNAGFSTTCLARTTVIDAASGPTHLAAQALVYASPGAALLAGGASRFASANDWTESFAGRAVFVYAFPAAANTLLTNIHTGAISAFFATRNAHRKAFPVPAGHAWSAVSGYAAIGRTDGTGILANIGTHP